MEQKSSFLKFNNVSFAYKNTKKVLSNISFEAKNSDSNQRGHITALMGESGSGKSTILKLILGNITDYSGDILMYPERPTISYVPQDAVLFEHLSPSHNGKYFEYITNYKNKFSSELYEKLVSTLGLKEVLNTKSVLEISGGQRQRLSLLRALSIKPDFLLLDEPCTGLDAEVKRLFLIQLRQLVSEYDLFVLYITHHHDEAKMIADDVIYLIKNEDTGCVDRVSQGSITNFLTITPSLDAANVFHFPNLNILPFSWDNQNISFVNTDKTTHFLTFNPSNINFNNESGFEFEVVSSSPILTHLRILGTDKIVMAETKNNSQKKYLSISGECSEYNNNRVLIKKVLLNNNSLIK